MNGTEKITDKILTDARRDADALIAKAEEEAHALQEANRAAVEKTLEEGRAAAKKEKDERLSRAASAEKMADRRAVLEAKTDAMDDVYRAALERLTSLAGSEKTSLYEKLLRDAVASWLSLRDNARDAGEEMPPVDVLTATVNDRDLETAKAVVAGIATAFPGKDLPPVTAAGGGTFAGGLCLSGGDVEINCTLEMLLAEHREKREGAVFAVLFPD